MRWTALAAGVTTISVILAMGCSRDRASLDAPGHPLCVDNASADGVYPKGDHEVAVHATLPDLELEAVDATGQPSPVALHDYFEPCAPRSRLLVIRTSAAWCGTCRWHASHTKEFLGLDVGGRLRLLDVLVAGDDNIPARPADIATWRSHIDAPQPIAVDPTYRLAPLATSRKTLPLFVFVDTKTMSVTSVLDDPGPEELADRVRADLARLDGAPEPSPSQPELYDGRFGRHQRDLIRDMTLPGAPPPDATNAKADDPAAAALGKTLFSDGALSPSGKVSCASCHDADKQLADGLPQSTAGVARVGRNSPAIALASHSRWQFWDGRADTLWVQALGPPENDKELGSTRLFVAHAVYASYKSEFEAVWGSLPDLSDAKRFPPNGKPGSPEWGTMTDADRDAATRVYVDFGKSIAAFERTLRVQPSALDRYVKGDVSALSVSQRDGLLAFFTAGCAQCHYGPRLTDDAFHALGFADGRGDDLADRGRIDGIALLLGAEISSANSWSDAPDTKLKARLVSTPSTLGAFKTPALRGAAGSAPYGHGGTLVTLGDAVKAHRPRAATAAEPWLASFDDRTSDGIAGFLTVLTAVPIVP